MKRLAVALAALAAVALCAGCGYGFGGGGGALPPGTRVVAVLPFANHTAQPGLSQQISAAVARAFVQRTRYHVQPTLAGSNAAVHGDLLSVTVTPVTFDATSGRASIAEVVLHLRAWVTAEPSGKVLYRNNDMVFHDEYEISPQQQNFIEEGSVAFERMSRGIGRTLVSDILEAF